MAYPKYDPLVPVDGFLKTDCWRTSKLKAKELKMSAKTSPAVPFISSYLNGGQANPHEKKIRGTDYLCVVSATTR